MSVWRFFRSMAGLESGRWCRGCTEPIARSDALDCEVVDTVLGEELARRGEDRPLAFCIQNDT